MVGRTETFAYALSPSSLKLEQMPLLVLKPAITNAVCQAAADICLNQSSTKSMASLMSAVELAGAYAAAAVAATAAAAADPTAVAQAAAVATAAAQYGSSSSSSSKSSGRM